MKTMKTTGVLLAGVAAVMLSGCQNQELKKLQSMKTDTFIVKTEKAEVRTLEEQILLVGSVKAWEEATLYPRVDGKLFKNILHEGDPVKRDQAVALIERDEVGVVYEPAPVPSTIDGVIGTMYQDVGAHVTLQTPIALVVNQTQVRIKTDVPERYLGKIFANQMAHVSVEAYPNVLFSGKVYKISPVIDSKSRTAQIEILVDNQANKLQSGMFAQVTLITGRKVGAVSVSKAALQKDDKGYYVFLAENGKASKKDISVGIQTNDYFEIKGGVRPGAAVINSGLFGLQDGNKVEVVAP